MGSYKEWVVYNPREVIQQAYNNLEGFQQAQKKGKKLGRNEVGNRRGARWKPPVAGSFKANQDATYDQHSKRMGGMIIRDAKGEILATLSCNMGGVSHPIAA